MPGLELTGAVDLIERQVRRVRRRRNLQELQRALYRLIAVAAATGALLVLFALRAGARGFAVAAWCLGAATLAGSVLVVRALGRRWVGASAAAGWIDRRAGLRGRLSTFVQLKGLDAAFFYPLLAAQNVEVLTRWEPQRLVPRAVPRGALAAALTATGVLVLVIGLAPRLRPPAPEIFYSDQPVDGVAVRGFEGIPGRVLLAPLTAAERADDEGFDAPFATPGEIADDRGALARLPETLQESIRRQLWGRSWEAVRDAMARAQKRRPPGGDADGTGALEAAQPREGWEVAGQSTETSGPGGSAAGEQQDGVEAIERRTEEAARQGAPATDGADAAARGAAAGAGTNTDPNLFGPPSATGAAGGRFELALGARVHGPRAGSHRPAGEAPPPAPDARPTLAARSRAEAALHHMPVPPAYEAIVRELLAHRTPEKEMPP